MLLLRRSLPLALASLVMTCGCTTVHPAAGPPEPPRPASGTAPTASRQPAPVAWPLGRLPRTTPAPTAGSGPAPASARAAETVAVADTPARTGPRRTRPARPAAPAPAPRAVRPPAPAGTPPRGRPAAPRRTYEMTLFCEAARGTVAAASVPLCR
ncbi:hypothetical protein [Streptomyces sp. NPDC051567]|uniref:hypothetical protein n=1 Tax=Streptomyces sp. NPDC051567 TaxID=3365660 RepID=UPI0037890529